MKNDCVVIKVANFLHSMPNIWVEVSFRGDDAKIISRSGYTREPIWDRQAIEAARKLLTRT